MADTISRSTIQSSDSETLTFDFSAEQQQKGATLTRVKAEPYLKMKENSFSFVSKTLHCDEGDMFFENIRTTFKKKKIV